MSPEFKDHPERGSPFLPTDRNMLSLVSREFRLLLDMNTVKIGKQKLTFLTGEQSKALSQTGFPFSKELTYPED